MTERALTLCVDDPIVLKHAGHILACTGKYERAEKILRRAIELNPYDNGTYGYLGWVLAPSTDPAHFREFGQILDRLLQSNHNHPGRTFWNLHKSVALTCAGEFDGAYRAALDAVDFNPQLGLAWIHALNAAGQLQQTDLADSLLRRCRMDLKPVLDNAVSIISLLSRDEKAAQMRTDGLAYLRKHERF